MKKTTKYFIYFILVAPILAKIIEWLFQISTGALQTLYSGYGIGIFFTQLLLIELFSFLSFFVLFVLMSKQKIPYNLAFVVGISYFLKELFNLIFVYQSFNYVILLALIVEPIFMYTLLGVFLPKLFFKELKGRC